MKLEENITKLTQLAEKMESQDISVQDALERYEQGIRLAEECLKELNGYKGKLIELKTQMDELNNDN